MFNNIKNKQSPLLGLDINSAAITLVELQSDGDNYKIEKYASAPIPEGIFSDNEVTDIEGAANLISELVKKSKTSIKNVAIALPASSTISKVVKFASDISENELEDLIEIEAEKHIPFPTSEASVDFDIIGKSANDASLIDVLIVAARSDSINKRVLALEQAGLIVKIVDLDIYARQRAFTNIFPIKNDLSSKLIGLIDFDTDSTSFCVLNNNNVVYTRDQVFGKQKLRDIIYENYKSAYQESIGSEDGTSNNIAAEVLQPYKDAVIQQISRSIQFFTSSASYQQIDKLVLVGKHLDFTEVKQEIHNNIGIKEIDIFEPCEHLSFAAHLSKPLIANNTTSILIACGLALRMYHNGYY